MKLEFTVETKPGAYHCAVYYSGVSTSPPGVTDLSLISAEPLDAALGEPVLPGSAEAWLILEYAENLILAGEGL